LLVLARHAPMDSLQDAGWLGQVLQVFNEVGWIGVDLFFVLSGFLISSLLFAELRDSGQLRIRRFLVRRGLKIYPSYYAAFGTITLLWVLRSTLPGAPDSSTAILTDIWPNAVFIQNYIVPHTYIWPHSWTVAIEEHFYFGLPFFLIALFSFPSVAARHRRDWRIVCFVLIAVCLLITLTRITSVTSLGVYKLYYWTNFRIDSLLFGVMLGYLATYHSLTLRRGLPSKFYVWALITTAAVMAYAFPVRHSPVMATIGFTVLYIAFGFAVARAGLESRPLNPSAKVPIRAALAWTGRYSYTIYLAHCCIFAVPGFESSRQWVQLFLATEAGWNPRSIMWVEISLFTLLSFAGGWMLARYVEQPVLRRRSQWGWSR